MPLKSYPIALLFIIFQPFLLFAQETTSEISGIIYDDDDSPLTDATVTATHLPSGTKYATTSRKKGRYNLPQMRVGGPYVIEVSFIGFKQAKQDNIMLLLGQDYKADFHLQKQVKSLSHVTVSANNEAKIFNENHTGTEALINSDQIRNMPARNRTDDALLNLVPFSDGDNFGGRSHFYNNLTVDGVRYGNVQEIGGSQGLKISGQTMSIETLDQIQVLTAPFDVRYGNFAGAAINVVTKSGTNKLKGSVYTYLSGPGTLGYHAHKRALDVTHYNNNIYGFNLSGPIIKNKLFFILNFEQNNLSTNGTDYTATKRDAEGNEFTSKVEADQLDGLRQFLIDKFNYNPGIYEGYKFNMQKDKFAIKFDWNINTKNKLTFKYNYFNGYEDNPPSNVYAPKANRQPGKTGLPFNGTGFTNVNRYNYYILELNSQFKNSASNKLQLAYKNLSFSRESIARKTFPLVDIMDSEGNTYTSFGLDPQSYSNKLDFQTLQLCDVFTLYKGKHEITIGTQNIFNNIDKTYLPAYAGVYRFRSLSDFYSSVNNGEPDAQRYVIQYTANNYDQKPGLTITNAELGLLIQDKWRPGNKLTLYYGIRADVPVYKNSLWNNPDIAALPFRDGKHYNIGEEPGANILISPRIGFNWDIGNVHQAQLRGGIGLFSGSPPLIWLTNISLANSGQLGSLTKRGIAFSPDITAYLPSPSEKSVDPHYKLIFTENDFKYPQNLSASLGFDKKLSNGIVITTEALFTKDIYTVLFTNVNLPENGYLLGGPDRRFRFNANSIHDGYPNPTPQNPAISEAILMTNSNKGYAYGLTLQAQKKISNFELSVAYTYSKAKTVTDLSTLQTNTWANRSIKADPNAEELANPTFYKPHRFIAYAAYRIPYAKHFATTATVFFEMANSGSGSYTYAGDLNNDGRYFNDLIYIPASKADILLVPVNTGGGPVTDNRTPDEIWAQLDNYIKQDKYLNKHRGQIAERNAVIFPYYKNIDLNITQDFYFSNRKTGTTHTFSVSVLVFNFLNLLDDDWGTRKIFSTIDYTEPYASSILQFEGIAQSGADAGRPMFSFPYIDPVKKIPLTESFMDDPGILSTWDLQISLRYSFR